MLHPRCSRVEFERLRPLTRQVDERAPLCSRLHELQRGAQYPQLHRRVPWGAERIAHRVIDEDAAGRLHLSCQITARRNAHGRNSALFYDSAYQTHGLVVERSGGYRDQ